MTEEHKQYTDTEKEAKKWLDETDVMQFSQIELLTMFHWHALKQHKNIDSCDISNESPEISQHHKDLEECVGRLLESIDKGKVSNRAIMGLRILTN